jgi:hypothetical protein
MLTKNKKHSPKNASSSNNNNITTSKIMMLAKCLTGLPLALLMMAPNQLFAHGQNVSRNLRSCRASLVQCDVGCTRDCDCQDGLVCYLRDADGSVGDYHYYGGLRDLAVPGCNNAAPGDYTSDYCIDPNKFPTKTLWYIGSDGKPGQVYPLSECRGDCDNDDDWYVVTFLWRMTNSLFAVLRLIHCNVVKCIRSQVLPHRRIRRGTWMQWQTGQEH